MKLYPPGGGEPVEHHKTNVKYLLSLGWTEKPKAEKPKKNEVN